MASSNRKESPAEPFKRVLGLAVRAIAADGEMQVSYAPGKPELDGKVVQLPEPSRVPSAKEVAVIRGWADSLALTAADQKFPTSSGCDTPIWWGIAGRPRRKREDIRGARGRGGGEPRTHCLSGTRIPAGTMANHGRSTLDSGHPVLP